MRIVRDQDSVGLLDFFCNCLIIHFLLLPFLFDSRGQDFCNISQDCHALILDLARKEVELVVHADVPRMRQAHGELPEGFLDEHRCHAADTELDEEDLCILV